MLRTVVRTCFVSCLLFTLVVPAGAEELLMPPQLRANVNVTGHRYARNRHFASGKLRLYNASGHRMTVNCQVTLTWRRHNGSEIAKRHRDLDGLQVGAKEIRKTHWRMMFNDPDRRFDNIPSNAVPHCRLA